MTILEKWESASNSRVRAVLHVDLLAMRQSDCYLEAIDIEKLSNG